jgi:hypothetical protein
LVAKAPNSLDNFKLPARSSFDWLRLANVSKVPFLVMIAMKLGIGLEELTLELFRCRTDRRPQGNGTPPKLLYFRPVETVSDELLSSVLVEFERRVATRLEGLAVLKSIIESDAPVQAAVAAALHLDGSSGWTPEAS